jgi:hypothetical protein
VYLTLSASRVENLFFDLIDAKNRTNRLDIDLNLSRMFGFRTAGLELQDDGAARFWHNQAVNDAPDGATGGLNCGIASGLN